MNGIKVIPMVGMAVVLIYALLVVAPAAVALSDKELASDWAQLAHYAAANKQLPSANASANSSRVVFFGDSITEGWDLDKFFPGKGYINRGISGQTTPQMLVRFRQDVLNLNPRAVLILAGTNDLAQNSGTETVEEIEGYITSMCELARANNISVVLSSIIPALDYPWRPGLKPASKIVEINSWLKSYAEKNKLAYIDYYNSMVDQKQGLPEELSKDGVHPTEKGYSVMAPLAAGAISRVSGNDSRD